MTELIHWDIYEITTEKSSITGMMVRGRIRKYAIQEGINLLTENAQKEENTVRFALLKEEDPSKIIEFIRWMIHDSKVEKVESNIPNPVLSKLNVNIIDRYTIEKNYNKH